MTTIAQSIAALPESSQRWAWGAVRNSQARILRRIAASEGPEVVALLRERCETEGGD